MRRLAEDLKRYGVRVWLDKDEIRPGNLFAKVLEQGIEQSRAVAIVVSPASMDSGWSSKGITAPLSLTQRKDDPCRLIPLLLHSAELPGFLNDRQGVDFREPAGYVARVAELVWGITGEKPANVMDLPESLPPLPPGSRMLIARNSRFVGRADELHALAEVLQVGSMAAIGQVASVTGLGAMGKTQLVTELVHRYGQFFTGGVFWLGFSDPASVTGQLLQCGGPAHLGLWSSEAAPDIDTQLAMVRTAFAAPVPRLLVFDNCEDEALLAEWRPVTGGCRLLVTCRRPAFSPHLGVHTLALDVLPRAESLALLRSLDRG